MDKNIKLIIGVVFGLVVSCSIGVCSCAVVKPGNRGVKVTFGEVSPQLLGEGLHIKSPFTSVNQVSVRQSTGDVASDAFSSDLQHVGISLKVLYKIPDASVLEIFTGYSGDPFDTLIVPRVQEALKETTATLSAEQIAKARESVKQDTLALVRKKIGKLLIIEDLVVENVTLSPQLQVAIEAKMVQEQEAAKSKFILQRAAIESETAIVRAKGDAESFRIRGDALRANPKVIEMRMVEKWDGKSPMVVGSGGLNMVLPLELKN